MISLQSILGAAGWRCSLLVAGALTLTGCGDAAVEPAEEPIRPAKLVTIEAASAVRSGSFPAVVRAVRSTDLAFQVGGQIVEWNARDGGSFQKGDVIARLDATSFQATVEQAEAQYLNASSEYERAQRLIAEDAISKSVLESREAQRQVAKASLDTAKKNLSDTVLRAPFTGGVGRTNVEQFQNVSPQQPILVLQSRQVEAIINVPARFVLNSNRTEISNVFVELDAAPGRQFPATFREARGLADSSTQTYEAHFNFTPPPELLVLTGMTARLFYDSRPVGAQVQPAGVRVPLAAIMVDGDKRYVWRVKGPDKALERRDVVVEDGVGDEVTVSRGLETGDVIVATGGDFLREGAKVREWRE
ncbi:MAG: efflux RND transporter periplasmic adaptor subunit [Pseudomonadota bacterium]